MIISKLNIKNLDKIIVSKFKKVKKKGNLSAHFGKLKRNIDGLKYKMEIRKNLN